MSETFLSSCCNKALKGDKILDSKQELKITNLNQRHCIKNLNRCFKDLSRYNSKLTISPKHLNRIDEFYEWKFLFCLAAILLQANFSYGGYCFISTDKDGKCTARNLYENNITRENCCERGMTGNSENAAYLDGQFNGNELFMSYFGIKINCKKCKESCENVSCPENKKCVIKNGEPKCICAPDCTSFRRQNGIKKIRGPVCGTDGRTYKNVCRLLKRSCRQNLHISVAYNAPCKDSCTRVTCTGDKKCLMDQNMIPHCVNCSDRKCHNIIGPKSTSKAICGSDGQTYYSMCSLRKAACQKGKAIPIAYLGPCTNKSSCETIKCLENQKCLQELDGKRGRCVTCSRKHWCKKYQRHHVSGPLCSTNGKTYKDWCEMMDESCSSGHVLETKYFGTCKKGRSN